jgi:CheY-like chemotaxis protein
MLRRLIGEDVDIVFALDESPMPIRADPGQLELVLINLTTNGRDAMPRGGRLTFEKRPVVLDVDGARRVGVTAGEYVLLAVSDTGSGMDAETLSHIFEPFFTTKEPGRGTGLGLPSVYGIVKQSGGGIWVYSEPGRGSTFKIYLPLQVASESRDRARAGPARPVRGRETILLAEDEPQIRQMVRDALQGFGYTVLVAVDVLDCRQLAETHPGKIDLLLTDVVMPAMSGRELAEHVRVLRPGIRVLYMSGYTDDAISRHGLLLPGCDLIEKPFTPTVLAQRIRQVLDVDGAEAVA